MIIQQALFGYSKGHHLISSSMAIPNSMLRILEPLSDLSGSDVQDGFSEYLTGYWFENEEYYCLSKTWYAKEMKRPGCVWTHSLFFRVDDLNKINKNINIENLFRRPNNNEKYYDYNNIIEVYERDKEGDKEDFSQKEVAIFESILFGLFSNNTNIIIGGRSSIPYNRIMLYMWKNINIDINKCILKELSFCTGSLANRQVNKKTLGLQVVPEGLVKSISRTVTNASIISESDNKVIPAWIHLLADSILMKNNEFNSYLSSFGVSKINKQVIITCSHIYLLMQEEAMLDWDKLLQSISVDICEDDRRNIFTQVVFKLINKIYSKSSEKNNIMDIVSYLTTTSNEQVLRLLDYDIIVTQIFKLYKNISRELFIYLINNEINGFGEKIISFIADDTTPNTLIKVAGSELIGSNILIKVNYKLALSADLWKSTKTIQMEALESLKENFQVYDKEFIKELLFMILDNSIEDITFGLYEVFNIDVLRYYFEWADTSESVNHIKKWSGLCKFNMSYCIKRVSKVDNYYVLQGVLNQIDPYNVEIKNIPNYQWTNLYYNLILSSNSKSTINDFAKLLLPIIIMSNVRFPEEFAYFVFSTVHQLLLEDKFNYDEWRRLSYILPEVTWYNDWDKCKRVRKAAKMLGYSFKLKSVEDN